MALNIKSPEAEQLVSEVATLTGETKTKSIRVALLESRCSIPERVSLKPTSQAES